MKRSSAFIEFLDKTIAPLCVLCENEVQSKIRRSHYGQYSDTRDASYGGFEYRVPATTLGSRRVTFIMYIVFAALLDAYNNFSYKTAPEFLPLNLDKFMRSDLEYFGKFINILEIYICDLPYFEPNYIGSEYLPIVKSFFSNLKNQKKFDYSFRDIKYVWQLDTRENLDKYSKMPITVGESFYSLNRYSIIPEAQ